MVAGLIVQKKSFSSALNFFQVRNKKILDIGCGTGRWCRILAEKGAIVTGIDISEEAINLAKAETDNKAVNFIKSSILQLELPSNSFDIITCVTVLQHIIDPAEFEKSIENIVRLLKKDGKILLMEVAPSALTPQEHSTAILSVRTEEDYISAFEKRGAVLEDILSTDVISVIQKRLIPVSKKIPKFFFHFLVDTLVLLSLPIEYLFSGSRLLTANSWHKVFLFSVHGIKTKNLNPIE